MNILQMSLSASVLIMVVVIIRACTLHKLPKTTFLILWGAVVCRLLIPFSITSRFSFYVSLNMARQMLKEKIAVSSSVLFSENLDMVSISGMKVPTEAGVSATAAPIEIVWLSGMCLCALFFIVVYLRCKREFDASLPVEADIVSRWLREHPLHRPVQIRVSDRINAPLTYGIFHPVILLPKSTDWSDEVGLKVILTHEHVHIRRFDALTKLVLTAVVCVHWFNPFVWIMYVLANRDIELACDEMVVRTFGETIKSFYALTLIELEEKKGKLTPLVSNFCKNVIEERIVCIMKMKKSSLAGMIFSLVLVAGITTVFATSPVASDVDVIPSEGGNGVVIAIPGNDTPTVDLNNVTHGEVVLNTDPDKGAIIARTEDNSLPNRIDGSVTLSDGDELNELGDSGDSWMSISAGKQLIIGRAVWGKGEQLSLFVESQRDNELEIGIISIATGTIYSETLKSGTGNAVIPIPDDGEYQIFVKSNSLSNAKVTVNYIVNAV